MTDQTGDSSKNSETVEIRAEPRAYWLFTGIGGAVLVFFMVLALGHRQNGSLWEPVVIAVVSTGLILLWLSRFRVLLLPDLLSYRCLTGGTRTVPVHAIESARIESGINKYSDRFLPPVRLVVKYKIEKNSSALYMNLKVFSRTDIQAILAHLSAENRTGVTK